MSAGSGISELLFRILDQCMRACLFDFDLLFMSINEFANCPRIVEIIAPRRFKDHDISQDYLRLVAEPKQRFQQISVRERNQDSRIGNDEPDLKLIRYFIWQRRQG